jgi:hypothetical protein
MSIRDFIQEIFEICHDSPLCGTPATRRLNPTSVNLRIPLTNLQIVDVFYNEQTGRTAFALIENEQRIFGADNTGSWHIHPFDNPKSHEPLDSPVSFVEFIRLIEQHSQ